jgi:hypothetical protein
MIEKGREGEGYAIHVNLLETNQPGNHKQVETKIMVSEQGLGLLQD